MKNTGIQHPQKSKAILLTTILFLLSLVLSARADFPPYLIIDGSLSTGYSYGYTDSNGSPCYEYDTSNGVLVLDGGSGGAAIISDNQSDAFNQLGTTADYWDGSNIYVANHQIVVPQVVVVYASWWEGETSSTMHGYDGQDHAPEGEGWDRSGNYVVSYAGIPDNYIFNFGSTPCYRYHASNLPTWISVNGQQQTPVWPSSTVFAFPSQIVVNGPTIQSASGNGYDPGESVSGGYTGWTYYVNASYTIELSVYLSSDSQTGLFFGYVNGTPVSVEWNPNTGQFSAPPGFGISVAPPNNSPSYGPPKISWDGDLLNFGYNDTNGSDVYVDSSTGYMVIVDANKSVSAITPNSGSFTGNYDPNAYSFDVGGAKLAAVTSDGNWFLGVPAGVAVLSSAATEALNDGSWNGNGPDYILNRADGKVLSKYTNLSNNDVYQIDDSPWYYYGGGDVVLNKYTANGWPNSNLPSPPTHMFVNGHVYLASQTTTNVSAGWYYNSISYTDPVTNLTTGVQATIYSGVSNRLLKNDFSLKLFRWIHV